MNPEYLNKKAIHLTDEQIFSCLNETLYQGLKMLSLQTKPEHARIVFDGIISIIRHRFNDFTMNQLESGIRAGIYGEYGDYTKMNPKTIMDWLNKKRLDVSAINEKTNKHEKWAKENHVIPLKYGGNAVILGLFYHEKGFKDESGNELSFQDRLKLIESGKKCPFTGKDIKSIIQSYCVQFKLERK